MTRFRLYPCSNIDTSPLQKLVEDAVRRRKPSCIAFVAGDSLVSFGRDLISLTKTSSLQIALRSGSKRAPKAPVEPFSSQSYGGYGDTAIKHASTLKLGPSLGYASIFKILPTLQRRFFIRTTMLQLQIVCFDGIITIITAMSSMLMGAVWVPQSEPVSVA